MRILFADTCLTAECFPTIGAYIRGEMSHGSGGGTSGRAMAFCLGRSGSNPGRDFGLFSFRIAVYQF